MKKSLKSSLKRAPNVKKGENIVKSSSSKAIKMPSSVPVKAKIGQRSNKIKKPS